MTKINDLLNGTLVLDGAMGTELEKQGVKTNDELWSANALIDNPTAIYQVHADYFKAGADIAITDTYQANVKAFAKNGIERDKAIKIIKSGVEIAKKARDQYKPTGLVAGCIGPYGAYLADGSEYTGDYQLTEQEYREFHAEKIKWLIEPGADLLSVDTIPNFSEVQALVKIINEQPQAIPYWISLSVKDPETLSDGTRLAEVVEWLSEQPQVSGIGVNCTKMENITPIIHLIRSISSLPVIVYPNPGDIYDPKTKTWTTVPHAESFQEEVPNWLSAGANVIGGCCRTTPADIEQISKIVTKSW